MRYVVILNHAMFDGFMLAFIHILKENPCAFIFAQGKTHTIRGSHLRHLLTAFGISQIAEIPQLCICGSNGLSTSAARAAVTGAQW